MPVIKDGPASALFTPVLLKGNARLDGLAESGLSAEMIAALAHAPSGACTAWGMRFEVGEVILLQEGKGAQPVSMTVEPIQAGWLVFMHTSDSRPAAKNASGFISPARGNGQLGEHAAEYVVGYEDGSEERVIIRRRFQVGAFQRGWGENCFEAVTQHKPFPFRGGEETPHHAWGWSQTRVNAADDGEWVNWLWAWQNPHPEKSITGFRFEAGTGTLVLSAVSAGNAEENPLRWQERSKTCLTLPEGQTFQPELDENGLLSHVQLDLGQVISATPRLIYPAGEWGETYNNRLPEVSPSEVLVEYTAHPQACFHPGGWRGHPAGADLCGAQLEAGLRGAPAGTPAGGGKRQPANGGSEAARARRVGRVPGAGRPPPHHQPGLV